MKYYVRIRGFSNWIMPHPTGGKRLIKNVTKSKYGFELELNGDKFLTVPESALMQHGYTTSESSMPISLYLIYEAFKESNKGSL